MAIQKTCAETNKCRLHYIIDKRLCFQASVTQSFIDIFKLGAFFYQHVRADVLFSLFNLEFGFASGTSPEDAWSFFVLIKYLRQSRKPLSLFSTW